MIKKLAWNTFKNTGNIDTYLELKQISDLERNIRGTKHENNKDQGDSNFRT